MDTSSHTQLAAIEWAKAASVVAVVPKWQLFFNYLEPSFRSEFIAALGQAYVAGVEYGRATAPDESA